MNTNSLIEKLAALKYSDSEIWIQRNRAIDEIITLIQQANKPSEISEYALDALNQIEGQ